MLMPYARNHRIKYRQKIAIAVSGIPNIRLLCWPIGVVPAIPWSLKGVFLLSYQYFQDKISNPDFEATITSSPPFFLGFLEALSSGENQFLRS